MRIIRICQAQWRIWKCEIIIRNTINLSANVRAICQANLMIKSLWSIWACYASHGKILLPIKEKAEMLTFLRHFEMQEQRHVPKRDSLPIYTMKIISHYLTSSTKWRKPKSITACIFRGCFFSSDESFAIKMFTLDVCIVAVVNCCT